MAVTLVVVAHLSISATILGAIDPSLSDPFYVGVQLFFIISGFVVTRSLLRGSARPDGFLIRRAFRLFPPLVAALGLSALTMGIFHLATSQKWPIDFFTTSTSEFTNQAAHILTGTFINYVIHPTYENGAMWTLSVEFQFYFFVTALLGAVVVAGVSKEAMTIGLLVIAAAVLGSSVIYRILLGFGYYPHHFEYVVNYSFDFMAAGVLLSLVPDRRFHYLRRFGRVLPIVLVITPIVLLTFCRSPLAVAIGRDDLNGIGLLVTQACYATLVACAIGGALSAKGRGWLYRLFYMIGERSYTIYVIHFACMALAWLAITSIDVSIAENAWSYAMVQPIITFLIMIPITETIYRFIEMPLNRYGHRMASRVIASGKSASLRNPGTATLAWRDHRASQTSQRPGPGQPAETGENYG